MKLRHNMNCSTGCHGAQVLRAVPKGARLLLECAGAVVAAAPSKFKVGCPTSDLRCKTYWGRLMSTGTKMACMLLHVELM